MVTKLRPCASLDRSGKLVQLLRFVLLYPVFDISQFAAQLPIPLRIMRFGVLKHAELYADVVPLVE